MNGPLLGAGLEHTPPSHIQRFGAFHSQNWNVPILRFLLLLNNHTQLQRPLAERKIETEQSYNKPPPPKKRNQKGKNKLKYTIHNVKLQIR